MKVTHQNESADDYSTMFPPSSLEPFNWSMPHQQPQHHVDTTPSPQPPTAASAGTTPCISPHTSTVDSPSSTITSPAVPMHPVHGMLSQMPLTAPMPASPDVKNSATSKVQSRAPIVKPSPAEEELVRCIHRKVGGPAKLSTYDDPAKVRHVVIEALANEQLTADEAMRIRKGQLSVFERRVVRTVTNRGAAVRSRMRQRKEMAHLRHQLRLRDARVSHLESVVRALCSAYAVPLPPTVSDRPAGGEPHGNSAHGVYGVEGVTMTSPIVTAKTEATTTRDLHTSKDAHVVHAHQQTQQVAQQQVSQQIHDRTVTDMASGQDATDLAANQQMFGSFVDHVVTHLPWS